GVVAGEKLKIFAQQSRLFEDDDAVGRRLLGIGIEVAAKFEPVDDEFGLRDPLHRLDQLHRESIQVLLAINRARSPTLVRLSNSRVRNLMPKCSSDAMMISICLNESQSVTSLALSSGVSSRSPRRNTSRKIGVSAW